jgi:phosphoglycolate phosphatase-like HAD superfamily hydrolase
VESAHAAGIYTIAVNTGPLPDSVLKEAGADMVLASMSELVEVLPKLLLIFQSS